MDIKDLKRLLKTTTIPANAKLTPREEKLIADIARISSGVLTLAQELDEANDREKQALDRLRSVEIAEARLREAIQDALDKMDWADAFGHDDGVDNARRELERAL